MGCCDCRVELFVHLCLFSTLISAMTCTTFVRAHTTPYGVAHVDNRNLSVEEPYSGSECGKDAFPEWAAYAVQALLGRSFCEALGVGLHHCARIWQDREESP